MVVDEAKLELMLARDELHQLVTAYCRAVDRADYEALRSLYHPDATDSHGSFSTGGVDQFIAQLQAAEPYVRVSQHNITTTNFVIDGDCEGDTAETARGEIYCLVFHTFAGPEHDIDVIIGGRYLDSYTKSRGPLEIQSAHHRGGLVIPKRPVPSGLRTPQYPRKPARQTRPSRPFDRLIRRPPFRSVMAPQPRKGLLINDCGPS